MHRNLVFLGASNLSRGFPRLVSLAKSSFDEELTIYAAKGAGRSFGLNSGSFGKKFPGIFSCGLWDALREAKPAPTSALITDIGNDLGYEVPVDQVLEWVTRCVDALLEINADIVISDLPLEPLRALDERRFRMFRRVLFPYCRLEKAELVTRAEQVSRSLKQLADARHTPIFSVSSQWYGLDPIHPRRQCLDHYWVGLLNELRDFNVLEQRERFSWLQSTYLRLLEPASSTFFGVQRRSKQPVGWLNDRTKIFLY